MPVEVLPELTAYRDLVLSVARALFFAENPSRVRTPKGFEAGFQLILDGITEGSAVPHIARRVAPETMFVEGDIFYRARDVVEQGIAAAASGAVLPTVLSRDVLTRFASFGRTLLPTERMIVGKPNQPGGAVYNRDVRHELLRLSMTDYEDDVDLIGVACEADKDAESFALRTTDGRRVDVRSSPRFFHLIKKTFTEDVAVRLRGTGIFGANGVLQKVVTTSDVSPAEEEAEEERQADSVAGCPTSLSQQIESLAELPDAWYDAESHKYNREELEWLRATLDGIVRAFKLPTPYVYPTPEGNVRAEWSIGGSEVVAELSLSERTGYVIVTRIDSGGFVEHTVRFAEPGAESDFGNFIMQQLTRSDA